MTQSQRDTLGSWWDRSKEVVTFAGGTIAILVFLWGVFAWLTGGIQLKSQSDLRDFSAQLEVIRANQSQAAVEAKASAKEAKDAQDRAAKEAQMAQQKIIDRLDAMPRPSDYSSQQASINELNQTTANMRSDLNGAQHDIQSLRNDVDSLRNPGGYRNIPQSPKGGRL